MLMSDLQGADPMLLAKNNFVQDMSLLPNQHINKMDQAYRCHALEAT